VSYFRKGGVHISSSCSGEPMRLTERDKRIECLDNLHCTSKQCALPHMSTVIPLFTCVHIDYISKMGRESLCVMLSWVCGNHGVNDLPVGVNHSELC
jgi:hypothetical protein